KTALHGSEGSQMLSVTPPELLDFRPRVFPVQLCLAGGELPAPTPASRIIRRDAWWTDPRTRTSGSVTRSAAITRPRSASKQVVQVNSEHKGRVLWTLCTARAGGGQESADGMDHITEVVPGRLARELKPRGSSALC